MSSWRITKEQGLVLIQFAPGLEIDINLLIKVYNELRTDPEVYPTSNFVWDLRDTAPTLDTRFEEMERLVAHFERGRETWWKHERTALVANSKVVFGMARMYAALTEGRLDHKIEIFEDDLPAALDWARPRV